MQKKLRGLAALSPERRRAIARLGGKAVVKAGSGHLYDSASGRKAGMKGKGPRKTRLILEKPYEG
jgi:hypothetical protein